jgi:hypothetical protein
MEYATLQANALSKAEVIYSPNRIADIMIIY